MTDVLDRNDASERPRVLSVSRTPGDFVKATRHLSVEDRGAYQELLDQIVILGQDVEPPSLPDDDRVIANLLGWSAQRWRKTKERLCTGPLAVLVAAGGRLSQTRIVEEIEAARKRILAGIKAGEASGRARASAKGRRQSLAERMTADQLRTNAEPWSNGRSNDRSTSGPTDGERQAQRIVNAEPNDSRTEGATIREPVRSQKSEVTSQKPAIKNHRRKEAVVSSAGKEVGVEDVDRRFRRSDVA